VEKGQYYVYVLQNPQGRLYIGQTQNLERRISEYNNPQHNLRKYTSRIKGLWNLIFYEEYTSRSEAMRREKWLKGTSGRRWLHRQIGRASPSAKLPD
jgi:putative endonuclease